MGWFGLAELLHQTEAASPTLKPREPQFPVKAKSVIHIILNGGLSQVDSFDPKPALTKYHGKTLPTQLKTERRTGSALKSPFAFKKYGQSGIPISEIFSDLGDVADELCVIRSMYTDTPNHAIAMFMLNCGESTQNRPSLGSWLTYGLGSINQNLPGYVVLIPKGEPTHGAKSWQSSFLPGVFQGIQVETASHDVYKMLPNLRNDAIGNKTQRSQLNFLQALNQNDLNHRPHEALLESRIQSFETAYRMQMAGSDAFDTARELETTRALYGTSDQCRQLLIARRLVERGVRFVQVWHGSGQPWDSHSNIALSHKKLGAEVSQGIGALIKDLKQRGMLNETLVVISTEFGRTPAIELTEKGNGLEGMGRDHNHHGFSTVLCGGGVKAGSIFGATDEFGYAAVENRVHVHDLHATILKLMGFDHKRLTYNYAGRDFRLTDVHGNIVNGIIA